MRSADGAAGAAAGTATLVGALTSAQLHAATARDPATSRAETTRVYRMTALLEHKDGLGPS